MKTLCVVLFMVMAFTAAGGAAEDGAAGPFPPGVKPRRVELRECVLIRERLSQDDRNPTTRFFALSKRTKAPVVKLQRRQDGWEIDVMGPNGTPLLAPPATNIMATFCHDVYAADLNGDGITDFVVRIWSGGSAPDVVTFLFSDGKRYQAESLDVDPLGPLEIARLPKGKAQGPAYFVRTECIMADGDQTKDGKGHRFLVYQLYRVDGAKLVRANGDVPGFPRWEGWDIGPDHKATDLLTPEQQKRLLDSREYEGTTQPEATGTDSSWTADWRHGASGICPVHHVTMHTEVVPGLAGVIDPTAEYADAKPRLFPHAGIDYGPRFYSKQRGLIYVCPDCVKARNKWREDHP